MPRINPVNPVWIILLLFFQSNSVIEAQELEAQELKATQQLAVTVPSAGVTKTGTDQVQESRVDDAGSAILSLFPKSTLGIEAAAGGMTDLNQQYSPGKSLWTEGLDEENVFHGEMIHRQEKENSFALRIGKGGQVYSLRGPFGESVPPSWRKEGSQQSPWNDEVWQFVAVCTKYNGFKQAQQAGKIPESTLAKVKRSGFADSFFVHNSGAYIPNDLEISSLYCPLLEEEMDQSQRCFRMLNWGLVPQIKTIHRSPILFYTQVRDVGNGAIELTWVVHNFSVEEDVVFDHLNAPWGGTRVSSLPLRYVSAPDGSLLERKEILNKIGVVSVEKTAGWNISCATDEPDSSSLALVYGLDKHLESELTKKAKGKPYAQFAHSLYRDWRASEPNYDKRWKDWQSRPANSFRNYDVCEVIPKLRIAPGTSIWYRSFLVVGPRDKVIQQATELVDHVDYGLLDFGPETTRMLPVSIDGDKLLTGKAAKSHTKQNQQSKKFAVFAKPVTGTKPLFLIENSVTDQQVVSTDPYIFVPQQKLDLQFPPNHPFAKYYSNVIGYSLGQRRSQWRALLGFGFEKKPESGNWAQLSDLLDKSKFPPASKFHLDLWVAIDQ